MIFAPSFPNPNNLRLQYPHFGHLSTSAAVRIGRGVVGFGQLVASRVTCLRVDIVCLRRRLCLRNNGVQKRVFAPLFPNPNNLRLQYPHFGYLSTSAAVRIGCVFWGLRSACSVSGDLSACGYCLLAQTLVLAK